MYVWRPATATQSGSVWRKCRLLVENSLTSLMPHCTCWKAVCIKASAFLHNFWSLYADWQLFHKTVSAWYNLISDDCCVCDLDKSTILKDGWSRWEGEGGCAIWYIMSLAVGWLCWMRNNSACWIPSRHQCLIVTSNSACSHSNIWPETAMRRQCLKQRMRLTSQWRSASLGTGQRLIVDHQLDVPGTIYMHGETGVLNVATMLYSRSDLSPLLMTWFHKQVYFTV